MENFYYCSTEIEQGDKCLKQCEYCITYFHKLECDRREEDLLEWVENRKKYPIGGFAPGNYTCNCVTCKEQFMGDKKAVQCEKCAIRLTGISIPMYSEDGFEGEIER